MQRPRVLSVLGLCILAVMVMAASASADPNPNSGRIPVEIPPDITVTDVCPFPVAIHVDINKEFSKEHQNGVTIITGRLVVTITNTATGESVSYNISGPGAYHLAGRLGDSGVPGPLAAVHSRHRHAGDLGSRGHHLQPRDRRIHPGEPPRACRGRLRHAGSLTPPSVSRATTRREVVDRSGTQNETCQEEIVASRARTDSVEFAWPCRCMARRPESR